VPQQHTYVHLYIYINLYKHWQHSKASVSSVDVFLFHATLSWYTCKYTHKCTDSHTHCGGHKA